MKDFLIGMGIGFTVGAFMVKCNKPLSQAVDKGKKMIEDTIEQGKDMVEDKIESAKKKAKTAQKISK